MRQFAVPRSLLAAIAAAVLFAAVLFAAHPLQAQTPGDELATLRGGPIPDTLEPPPMPPVSNRDLRQVRNYPEQPPVIPHKIDGYQIDRNANKCLTCHSRTAIADSQAPMLSITHFMDRDGQSLASVSPRRYFCNQCHVMQTETGPAVDNTFIDIDSLLRQDAGASQQ